MSEQVAQAADVGSEIADSKPSTETKISKSKVKGKAGRPTKLSETIIATACTHMAVGAHIETSFEAQGISRATYYRWKTWAEEGVEPYAKAFVRILASRSDLVVRLGAKRLKLLNQSTNADEIYRAMNRLDRERYPLDTGGSGISVTQNVNTDNKTLVVQGAGAGGAPAAQLTVEGAEAIQRKILLGGQTPEEVMHKMKSLKTGNNDVIDAEEG